MWVCMSLIMELPISLRVFNFCFPFFVFESVLSGIFLDIPASELVAFPSLQFMQAYISFSVFMLICHCPSR